MLDIVQFSIDVEGQLTEDQIREALEKAGINVLGIAWKASWTNKDYYEGKEPYSWD